MTNFPNGIQITKDLNPIIRQITAYGRQKAERDEASGVLPPIKVCMPAGSGYTVADVLDYDCEQSYRGGKTFLLVDDVVAAKEDALREKQNASPVVRRALTRFLKDMEEAIASFRANRVNSTILPALRLMTGSSGGYGVFPTESVDTLVADYNKIVWHIEKINQQGVVVEPSTSGELVLVGVPRMDITLLTITPFIQFGNNGEMDTRYKVKLGSHRYTIFSKAAQHFSTPNNDYISRLLPNGCLIETDFEQAIQSSRRIILTIYKKFLGELEREITNRLTKLAEEIGPVTLSFDNGDSVVLGEEIRSTVTAA